MSDFPSKSAQQSKVFSAALELARAKKYLFPCNPMDKRPLTVHGFKDATIKESIITRWWQQWPNAMIGMPTGELNGFFCVDLDKKTGGYDGVVQWGKLEQENAPVTTRKHITPSTGMHLLFNWVEGIRNIPLDKLELGVEVKGDGGYIVVPPSQMADGREYFSNEADIADAPDWLIIKILCYLDSGRGISQTWPRHYDVGNPPTIDEVRDALNQITSDPYENWFRIGAALRNTFGENGFSLFEEWSRKSRKFNVRSCKYKWKKFENVKDITFGSIYWLAKDSNPNWEWRKKADDGGSNKKDEEKDYKHLVPIIDISNWDNVPPPKQEWAVDNRIPLRTVCLFTGEGAAGKSLMQMQLSVAHILQKEWMGVIPRQGPVIYFDAEDEPPILQRRLTDVLNYYGAKFKDLKNNLYLTSLAGQDALLATFNPRSGIIQPTGLFMELLAKVKAVKPVMISIASSADVFAGNEIDRSQVRQFISLLTRLAIAGNSAVNLIAHPSLTGINTETGLSGNTAWHNAVRSRMYLKSNVMETTAGTIRELQFKKNNYGPISDSVMVRWHNGVFVEVSKKQNMEQAKDIFLLLLHRYNTGNRIVGDKKGTSYAPAIFVDEKEARENGCTKEKLADAMLELLAEKKIRIEPYGKRPSYRLVISEKQERKQQQQQDEMPF